MNGLQKVDSLPQDQRILLKPLVRTTGWFWFWAGLMALIAASTAYCRQYLMPQINEYRDRSRAGEAGTTEVFDKLHRRSEVLNGLQLLAVMAVLLHLAFVQFS